MAISHAKTTRAAGIAEYIQLLIYHLVHYFHFFMNLRALAIFGMTNECTYSRHPELLLHTIKRELT